MSMVPTAMPTMTPPDASALNPSAGIVAMGSGVRQAAAVTAPAREAAAAAVSAASDALDQAQSATVQALSNAQQSLMAAPAALGDVLSGTAAAAAAGAAALGAAVAAMPSAVMSARLPDLPALPTPSLPEFDNGYVAFDKHNRTWLKGNIPETGPRAGQPHGFRAMPTARAVPQQRVKTPPRVVPVPVAAARPRRRESYGSLSEARGPPPPGVPPLIQLRAMTHRLRFANVTDWYVAPMVGAETASLLSQVATAAFFVWIASVAFTAGAAIYDASMDALMSLLHALADASQRASEAGGFVSLLVRLLVIVSALGFFGFGVKATVMPYMRAPRYSVPPRGRKLPAGLQ